MTGYFALDVLATIPIDLIFDQLNYDFQVLKSFKLIRIVRLLRVFKLTKFFSFININAVIKTEIGKFI